MISEIFRGYFAYSDEEMREIWDNAVIFLDANVLLNFFEYSNEAFQSAVELMLEDKISGRFYVTHQIALEYSRNRIIRIDRQNGAADEIGKAITESLNKTLNDVKKSYKRHRQIDIDGYINGLQFAIEKLNSEFLSGLTGDSSSHQESVERFIDSLICDHVTSRLSETEISGIISIGKKRFAENIPPGYKDESNKDADGRKYADYLIWCEIIKYCSENNIKHLLFITDDLKEDWWWRIRGRTVGPRPELIQEMKDHEIKYYQYNSEQFLRYASGYLKKNLDSETMREFDRVSEQQTDKEPIFTFDIKKSYQLLSQDLSRIAVLRLAYLNDKFSELEYEERLAVSLAGCLERISVADLERSKGYLRDFYDKFPISYKGVKSFSVSKSEDSLIALENLLGELESLIRTKEF